MSVTYNITTNFAAKDNLPSNDPAKVINGTDFSEEYNAIKDAFDECAPSESPTFTGDVTFPEGSLPVTGDNGQTLRYGTDWEATSDLVVDDDGNVGIGTDNPTEKLEVFGSVKADAGVLIGDEEDIYLYRSGPSSVTWRLDTEPGFKFVSLFVQGDNVPLFTNASGPLALGSNNTESMRIDSNGNVGIGTATPVNSAGFNTLTLNGASGGQLALTKEGVNQSLFYSVSDTTNVVSYLNNLDFYTGGAAPANQRMRIDSSGNANIGTTVFADQNNPGFSYINATGSERVRIALGNTQGSVMEFFSGTAFAGTVFVNGNQTSYNSVSDERLKENIEDALSFDINSIKVRQFDWKSDGSHQDYGFIAQELAQIVPEAVTKGRDDEDIWAVDPSKIVPRLIKSIQEQQQLITELTQRVAELEA